MRFLILALLIGGTVQLPAATDPSPVPTQAVQAQACLKRLHEIADDVAAREKTAREAGQTARADCLGNHHASLAALVELAEAAQERLLELAAPRDAEAIAAESATVAAACARAETLAIAAVSCNSAARLPHASVPPAVPANHAGPPRAEPLPAPRPEPLADGPSCLRQQRLASLLVQAMGLASEPPPPPSQCVAVLTERHIAPLTGWQPDRCATLDDFCVIVAGALQLKLGDGADDAARYLPALRAAGLPVDALLPPRPTVGPPPVLQEFAVRAFLAQGYATPRLPARPVELAPFLEKR